MKNKPRKSLRSSRRANSNQPTVWEAIKGTNKRARARVNRRVRSKKAKYSMHAAIDEVHGESIQLSWGQRLVSWCVAIVILPLCVISLLALLTLERESSAGGYWFTLLKTQEFLYFAVGFIITAAWHFTGLLEKPFLYIYVWGHELTHAVFVLGFLGKVSGIGIEKDRGQIEGGYILTNKTNFLIALSPYFVPFWSLVSFLLFILAGLFVDIPYRDNSMYFCLGAGWSFHLLWTLWMIPQDQPDLRQNGMFFSLIFIVFANILILATLFCLALGGTSFVDYFHRWWDLFMYLYEYVRQLIQSLLILKG